VSARAICVQPCMHSDATGEFVTAETGADPLTSMASRPLLVERLSRSIERASRYPGLHFAILCVEVDRRSDGVARPDAPDPLLQAVALRLESSLRARYMPPTLRHDDIVARLDGDAFGILLDGLKDLADATLVADRILAEMLEPFSIDGGAVTIAASIGVSLSATGYVHADDVLRDAASAAHRAALLGGSRCEVFDPEVLKVAQAELRLEADFAAALERDEFFLLYQPIVSLASNRLEGFEALVRWQHPVLGLIAPLEFIPLAERTGFIVPLGKWVLDHACRQLKAWEALAPGADVWMSVNLSSVQFKRSTLVEEITEILRDSGLEPRRLILELTESIAMENPPAVRASLLQLRAIGVRVSLDDFGTGHSSLAYLRQFPLDSLKVDRSFVRGIETDGDMASIVNAVKSMAHQLGLRIVAEGIEKDEQLALLRSLDCEMGQGYLFSRPVDANDAAALLTSGLPLREPVAPTAPPALLVRPSNPRQPKTVMTWRSGGAWRWLSAAAGVVVLVLSAGLPRLFGTRLPEVAPPAASSVTAGRNGSAVAADRPLPPPAAAPAALPAPSRAAGPASSPARTPRSSATVPVAPSAPAAVPNAPAVVPKAIASLRVVHQHRLGSCRGLLVVTRDGVEYQPDETEHQVKDGFAFPYTRFLSEKSGASLVIKSNNRDYRFKADMPEKASEHIEQIDAAIARLR